MVDDESRRYNFGPQEQPKGVWDRYKGQYIIIHNPGNMKTCAGKLIDIEEGCYGILSPFVGGSWDEESNFERVLKEGQETVPLPGSIIEPTTRQNVENYVKYSSSGKSEKKAPRRRASKKRK